MGSQREREREKERERERELYQNKRENARVGWLRK